MADRTVHRTPIRRLLIGALLAALIGTAGCQSTSRLDAPGAGKTVSYAPGVPNFDIEVLPRVRSEISGVDLHVSVPHLSLIFVQEGRRYAAAFELTAEVYDEEGERLIRSRSWTDSVKVDSFQKTKDYRPFDLERWIELDPGTYVLRVRLLDRRTDRQAVRLKRVTVPEFERARPLLAPLYVESKAEGGAFRTVAALHLSSGEDSIRVASELYSAGPARQVDVRLALVRYETDSEVAIPPYWLSPNRGSLEYHGVDYGRADTVEQARYRIEDVGERAEIGFMLPDEMSAGMYRITLRTTVTGAGDRGDTTLTESRDLSIKGPDFPSIAELDEVIEALSYIAREREIEEIREGATLEERRRRFDAFWGDLVGNKQRAADLIRRYYSRVEEANLFFTTYKEGWKTDRGMVYVVKGAPLFVEQYFEAEVWHYSYAQDPRQTYVFERVRPYRREGVQFDNYILMRRPYYERPWREAVERWRNGRVL